MKRLVLLVAVLLAFSSTAAAHPNVGVYIGVPVPVVVFPPPPVVYYPAYPAPVYGPPVYQQAPRGYERPRWPRHEHRHGERHHDRHR